MIRVAIIDDHPVVRAGVNAAMESADDIAIVGEGERWSDVWPLLEHSDPDVVLMDVHLPEVNGIVACHRIKRLWPRVAVVVYSAYADTSLVLPSVLAQADALVAKGARFPVLCEAVREAAAGATRPPEISGAERQALNELLDPADVAIAGLLLLRTSSAEIARMTGVSGEELSERVEAILHRVLERRDALAAGSAVSLA